MHELGKDEWVIGISVEHHESELTLAPIAFWHRFQVELAQSSKYDRPDNDFVCGRYFVTFSVNFMKVLIKVNVNKGHPTFHDINVFVKPLRNVEDSDGRHRKQLQVDLAGDLVEVLMGLRDEVCPGVEYLQRVVWPWPAAWSGLHVSPDKNLDLEQVKELVRKHGLGWPMLWEIGNSDAIAADQLLSTKDKDGVIKENLFILRQGITEAIELGIFPHDLLNEEGCSKESTLPSLEIHEDNQPISPLGKLVLSKLDKMDKKLDQNNEKLNKRLDNFESLIQKGFSKQRDLLHKIRNTGQFFLQDRERKCPRFIYFEKNDSKEKSGLWMTLKEALSPYVTVRLHFACEARYNDSTQHPVYGQQGLDMSNLRGWAEKIVPWLRVSLTVLYISAKVGANFVAPGLGLIVPNFVDWQQASSLSEGLARATGFSKEELDKHMVKGMGLNANHASWDPQELYGKSREGMIKLLEKELTPKAYEEKIGLQKVCFNYDQGSLEEIAWICSDCFEKYRQSKISIREL